jgi:8-oxo-dGTP diphosphatase
MRNRPRVGVAAIVIKDGAILLGKRKNAHGEGSWQFPGGHLEYGETIEGCARREVFEETGIEIGNLRLGPYTNDVFGNDRKHYITLFVVSEYESGELALREPDKCEEWGWFAWDSLPEPRFLPITNLLKLGFDIEPYMA